MHLNFQKLPRGDRPEPPQRPGGKGRSTPSASGTHPTTPLPHMLRPSAPNILPGLLAQSTVQHVHKHSKSCKTATVTVTVTYWAWVPASAGKAKAGMVHSVSGWTRGVQAKLRDPLRMRVMPELHRGVFTTRCYTNSRLPLRLPNYTIRSCRGTVTSQGTVTESKKLRSEAWNFERNSTFLQPTYPPPPVKIIKIMTAALPPPWCGTVPVDVFFPNP